jgi:hypothetical protein
MIHDTQHNDTQHDVIEHKAFGTQHKDLMYDIQPYYTRHNWHTAEQNSTIMLYMPFYLLSVIMLNTVMLSVIILNVVAP